MSVFVCFAMPDFCKNVDFFRTRDLNGFELVDREDFVNAVAAAAREKAATILFDFDVQAEFAKPKRKNFDLVVDWRRMFSVGAAFELDFDLALPERQYLKAEIGIKTNFYAAYFFLTFFLKNFLQIFKNSLKIFEFFNLFCKKIPKLSNFFNFILPKICKLLFLKHVIFLPEEQLEP